MQQIPKIIKTIILNSHSQPSFSVIKENFIHNNNDTIAKVLYFSIDPVMRVWVSGAKTNFNQTKIGQVFNCFGLGKIVQTNNQNYQLGSYIFGNTGTTQYVTITEQKIKQLFIIPQQLIEIHGEQRFLYLINNGLAAYAGYKIINPQKDQTILVSTAAGATGLLFCELLKKNDIKMIGLTSQKKISILEKLYPKMKILNYKNQQQMKQYLSQNKFQGYFDNVGQQQLDLVLKTISNFGRLALCGAISTYQNYNSKTRGLKQYRRIIDKRLTIGGINFSEYIGDAIQIFNQFKNCNIQIHLSTMEQFESDFKRMLQSANNIIGKIIVKI